jgi:hypothetical protein
MPDENPLANANDDKLVSGAWGAGATQGAYVVEMMRRLKGVLENEMRVANELSGKIHRLNQALLWYTVAIALMAAFQFGAWIRDLIR